MTEFTTGVLLRSNVTCLGNRHRTWILQSPGKRYNPAWRCGMKGNREIVLTSRLLVASAAVALALSQPPSLGADGNGEGRLHPGAKDKVAIAPDTLTAQVVAVLNRQVEAWNRRDLEGFMQGYWRSPELTFYSGSSPLSGWQSTLDRYRQRYQGEGREMGHLDFSELQVQGLGSGAAFVRGRWHLKMTTGEAGGLFTLIFRHFDDGWKIIHDHTSSSS